MGLLKFSDLPVNPLVGARWKTFKEIVKGRKVEKGWKGKYYLTKGICAILSTLCYFEDKKYEEISELVGTSIGALKASYHIAVEKITTFIKSKE